MDGFDAQRAITSLHICVGSVSPLGECLPPRSARQSAASVEDVAKIERAAFLRFALARGVFAIVIRGDTGGVRREEIEAEAALDDDAGVLHAVLLHQREKLRR